MIVKSAVRLILPTSDHAAMLVGRRLFVVTLIADSARATTIQPTVRGECQVGPSIR